MGGRQALWWILGLSMLGSVCCACNGMRCWPYNCREFNGVSGCESSCTSSADCAGGAQCGSSACNCTVPCLSDSACSLDDHCSQQCCQPPSSNGESCSTDMWCSSGHCVKGVCCGAMCDGGRVCNPEGYDTCRLSEVHTCSAGSAVFFSLAAFAAYLPAIAIISAIINDIIRVPRVATACFVVSLCFTVSIAVAGATWISWSACDPSQLWLPFVFGICGTHVGFVIIKVWSMNAEDPHEDVMMVVASPTLEDGPPVRAPVAVQPQQRRRPACPERVITLLPSHVVQAVTGDDTCVICLCSYDVGEVQKRLPCTHAFHGECIDGWLQRSNLCPLCNGPVAENPTLMYMPPSWDGPAASSRRSRRQRGRARASADNGGPAEQEDEVAVAAAGGEDNTREEDTPQPPAGGPSSPRRGPATMARPSRSISTSFSSD